MNGTKSEVASFYVGRTLLVTGASGFMGKVLLEKLLYACTDLHQIFILIRPKRGKSVESRMEEMYKSPLFHRIRDEKPEAFKKIVPMFGDVLQEGLGLSEENKKRITDEVSVVIHSAATLKLEAKLKDAVEMNVVGTYRVLELAKQIKNLKVFVHVSTAFCHVDVEVMEEKIYDTPISPKDIMRMCEWMDEQSLDIIQPRVLHPHPNSYTYSKRLAEALVDEYFPEIPACIVRPSIVTPSVKEPVPGWVDNLNGPVGLLIGGGKGVIRTMHCKAELLAQLIPVDFAINGIIVVTSKVGRMTEKPKEMPVYNLTQGNTATVSWGRVLEIGREIFYKYPFSVMLWYPDGNIRSSKLVHDIYAIFYHWIPAYLIDGLLFIFGQKRFMIRVQNRIAVGLEVLQYFTTRQWNFKNDKLLALRAELKGPDKETFAMPFEEVEEVPYMTDCMLGARQYLCKEDPANIPRARRNLKLFWLLDRFVALLFYFLIFWMIYSSSDTVRGILDSVVETLSATPVFRRSIDKTPAE